MQTIEAMISFFVFLSITSFLLTSTTENGSIDDSIYKFELTEDVWRVLYLRGDFEDFSSLDFSDRSKVEKDLVTIGDETGLCIFIDGIVITNCRSGTREHYKTASLSKSILNNGKPEKIMISIGK